MNMTMSSQNGSLFEDVWPGIEHNSEETAWPGLGYNGSDNFSELVNYEEDEIVLKDPQFYSYRYRVIGTFFQGIILMFGVLGNLMVVIVVTRTRSMQSPTNCYLMSMAVADCVVLLASVPNEILYYYLVGNLWIWGDVGCAGFIFFQNLGINASSLSLVAFTVERYIAICHPLKAHTVCTLSRARRIVYGVWVFATVYCCPWLGLTTTRLLGYKGYPGARSCDFKLPRHHYLAYFFADLVVFYVLPLIISCVLYGLITRVLFTRRFGVDKSNNRLQGNATSSTSSSKDQVVKMLAMVVFVFATLWLPYRGMLVYNSFAMLFSRKRFMDLWFLMFAKTCIYINCAINPILYSMMSAKFRRAFHRVLCGTGPLNNHDTPYTSTRNFSTSTRSSSRKHCSRSSSMSMKKTSGFKRGTSERNRSTLHTATTAC